MTGYRERGYNVGSIMTAPGEAPQFDMQPAHPLRFSQMRYKPKVILVMSAFVFHLFSSCVFFLLFPLLFAGFLLLDFR
jgi:hypothetical protein